MTATNTYRDYRIERSDAPAFVRDAQFQFTHAEYDGPEDRRCGFGRDEADCRAQIDDLIAEGF